MRESINNLDMQILNTEECIEEALKENINSKEENLLEELLFILEDLRNKITTYQEFKGWLDNK